MVVPWRPSLDRLITGVLGEKDSTFPSEGESQVSALTAIPRGTRCETEEGRGKAGQDLGGGLRAESYARGCVSSPDGQGRQGEPRTKERSRGHFLNDDR